MARTRIAALAKDVDVKEANMVQINFIRKVSCAIANELFYSTRHMANIMFAQDGGRARRDMRRQYQGTDDYQTISLREKMTRKFVGTH